MSGRRTKRTIVEAHEETSAGATRVDRRELLRMLGASMPLAGVAACARQPAEEIVPYVRMPEYVVPGRPVPYASTLSRGGYGTGVLVQSHTGRPTKVEGNPLHPASLGATDVFAQAAVLDLYDPDRSKTIHSGGRIATAAAFADAWAAELEALRARRGEGLFVLSETLSSPTLARGRAELLEALPRASWHEYEPVHRDHVYEGARIAFGAPLETIYDFDAARVIVSIDADFVASLPGSVRYARAFAARRRPETAGADASRLYALESAPSPTGAMADHAVPVRAADMEACVRALARRLRIAAAARAEPSVPDAWLDAAAQDLERAGRAALVVPGDHLSPASHALCHAINERLGGAGTTAVQIEPVPEEAAPREGSLAALAQAMDAGAVETLVILGGNPAYSAPADLEFAERLARVATSVHWSLYDDETSALCDWHLPAAHALESWGDARAFDGTASIVQPLIAPLYAGLTAEQLVARLRGAEAASAREIVRRTWQGRAGSEFDAFWRRALTRGVIDGTGFEPVETSVRAGLAARLPEPAPARGLEIQFRPDPRAWDGRFANNAWLQELPKPLSGLVWDNAVLVSPATAAQQGLENAANVTIEYAGRELAAPVWISPGHADGSLTLFLGYGRRRAGRLGTGAGYDAYVLRASTAPWYDTGAVLRASGGRADLVEVQQHHRMEGRDPVRVLELDELLSADGELLHEAAHDSLYEPFEYPRYAWGMSIDLNACIGCQACTIACQAENNIPVVGKREVARGREMHWIRVDRYYEGPAEAPRTYFQPVPCMHCERAPCEYVCPVHAAVHDSEGLNLQVYNRCIGTRDCSQNCPYKVRRFNWFDYNGYEGGPPFAAIAPVQNPSVTVRSRGVMEKCTYCIQRISRARIDAKREGRRIADGDVVTACQAVCPSEAIVFGDINDAGSRVSARKSSRRDYSLLGHLNTQPRTTYLARVRNPNPALAAPGDDA